MRNNGVTIKCDRKINFLVIPLFVIDYLWKYPDVKLRTYSTRFF
jgi:hypothetical protein